MHIRSTTPTSRKSLTFYGGTNKALDINIVYAIRNMFLSIIGGALDIARSATASGKSLAV